MVVTGACITDRDGIFGTFTTVLSFEVAYFQIDNSTLAISKRWGASCKYNRIRHFLDPVFQLRTA
jgi:hypothetical protein